MATWSTVQSTIKRHGRRGPRVRYRGCPWPPGPRFSQPSNVMDRAALESDIGAAHGHLVHGSVSHQTSWTARPSSPIYGLPMTTWSTVQSAIKRHRPRGPRVRYRGCPWPPRPRFSQPSNVIGRAALESDIGAAHGHLVHGSAIKRHGPRGPRVRYRGCPWPPGPRFSQPSNVIDRAALETDIGAAHGHLVHGSVSHQTS